MDPEQQKRFNELYDMVRENNGMLKKIRRAQKSAQMMRALYWVLIIAITIGTYYYLEPYLKGVLNVYTNGVESLDTFKTNISGSSDNLDSLLKGFNP